MSFYFGVSKLVTSLAKTEHTQRKLFNSMMPSYQELGINLECKMPEMDVLKNFNSRSFSPKDCSTSLRSRYSSKKTHISKLSLKIIG